MVKPLYTWSDAWVLAAVAVGGGDHGAPLREIIAAGDLINRAIFSPQELRRGLAKLTHDGYVRAESGSFAIAGAAKAAAAQITNQNPSSYHLLQFFEDFLEAAAYPAGDPHQDDPLWMLAGLTDADVASACEAYRQEFAALYKDATGREPGTPA